MFRSSVYNGAWNGQRTEDEVNLGIAAVVEAIDHFQSDQHEESDGNSRPFASGLSLATSDNIALALVADEPAGGMASRPRRCFLMPLTVGDQLLIEWHKWRLKQKLGAKQRRGDGHHLLAVVQKVGDGETKSVWETNFCDSSRDVFSDSVVFLTERVFRAIKNLQWTSHRNADEDPDTPNYETDLFGPQQTSNEGGSAAHTQ